jgi:hypothetical protein
MGEDWSGAAGRHHSLTIRHCCSDFLLKDRRFDTTLGPSFGSVEPSQPRQILLSSRWNAIPRGNPLNRTTFRNQRGRVGATRSGVLKRVSAFRPNARREVHFHQLGPRRIACVSWLPNSARTRPFSCSVRLPRSLKTCGTLISQRGLSEAPGRDANLHLFCPAAGEGEGEGRRD